jgi:hypothetical protein
MMINCVLLIALVVLALSVGFGVARSRPNPTVNNTAATTGGTSAIPTSSPTSTSQVTTSPSASSTLQQLQITINYDIENQCGLDAEKVMNEDGNTLASGLIAATTTVTIDTLNTTFSREGSQRNMRGVKGNNSDRDLVYVEVLPHPVNNRVYYNDGYPVVIDQILDIEKGCDEGTSCLFIISTALAFTDNIRIDRQSVVDT